VDVGVTVGILVGVEVGAGVILGVGAVVGMAVGVGVVGVIVATGEVVPTTAQSDTKLPGCGPCPAMVIVAVAILQSPAIVVALPFCHVIELLTFGVTEVHDRVIGWLEYPVVQLNANVVFTDTKSML